MKNHKMRMVAVIIGNLPLPKIIKHSRGSEAKNRSLHTPLKPGSGRDQYDNKGYSRRPQWLHPKKKSR